MKKFFEEHDLAKFVLGILLVIVIASWIIPTGSFGYGGAFTEGEMGRIGLVHMVYAFTFAIQNYSIQIGYLLVIGIFYGVMTHTEGYKALVEKLAKFGKKKEVLFSLVVSFIIAFLASFLNNSFILLAFIPLVITVLRKMGFDKISAFATTFGSILVGVLGATYGTEGLGAILTYLTYGGIQAKVSSLILVRFGILALAFIIYSFFLVRYNKKQFAKKKNNEVIEEDLFYVDEPKKKKTKVWPTVTIFAILFVLAILGFITWNVNPNGETIFGITIFDDFHKWLMGIKIGSDDGFAIFKTIVGNVLPGYSYDISPALGSWYLFNYSTLLLVVTIITAFISRMKVDEFFTNAYEGLKKVVKPTLFLVLAYVSFVLLYFSPIMPTIVNEIGKLSNGAFNPFVMTLQAFVGSIFNTDIGFLSYTVMYSFSNFADKGEIVFLIYLTIFGLVSFVTPIATFLLYGLSFMDIKYTKWFKYIWKFFVAMLVCLVVIFALLTYL